MIITIARQCGCGALHIGELLSKNLGLVLYTRQMLIDMAVSQGMGGDVQSFVDERQVDDILMAISDSYEANPDVKQRFCELFRNVIGNRDCIVIGRCGNSIFAGRDDLVSVFLKGDLSMRVKAIADAKGISANQAETIVNDTDDRRMLYHKYYTGLTWGAASDYDLCIDSLRLGSEACANLIAEYARGVCRGDK
ncbi:MAG: AAA family ATPase [Muribaculaceae bacterium]